MKEKKATELGGGSVGSREDLEGVREVRSMIRIYCLKKILNRK